jgi:hypothetical protein
MINIISVDSEIADTGFVLRFPAPRTLRPSPIYNLEFDNVVSLPDLGDTVTFDPVSAKYSVINDNSFVPQILVRIRSIKRLKTQNLIRLTIKNEYNIIIYTDYLLIESTPVSSFRFSGNFSVSSNNIFDLGNNGGLLIRASDNNIDLSRIRIGSRITREGGLKEDEEDTADARVIGLVNVDPPLIEINKTKLFNITNYSIPQNFTVSIDTDCVNPDTIEETETSRRYIILDEGNNWTYTVANQIIARFVPDKTIAQPEYKNISFYLPIKSTSLLANNNIADSIPLLTKINVQGRIENDTICVTTN